jgi:glycosyltransferase involved in cell wall biosynthesis
MKLVIAAGIWPRISHSVNAAPVVAFELINALADQPDITVGFLKLSHHDDLAPNAEDENGIAALRARGIDVQELRVPRLPVRRWFPWIVMNGRLADFVPETDFAQLAGQAVARMGADAVMPMWTEWGTAMLADAPALRFAYYGNPDPKNFRIQIAQQRELGHLSWLRWQMERRAANVFEREHLARMRRYQLNGNVAANDAQFYRDRGVNSFYIQNVWIDRLGDGWREKRAALENRDGSRIIGNVGKLGATANTLGMQILGRDVLPQLRRAMTMPFEIHILGGGKLRPDVEKILDAPEVKLRGFVDDIDEEILKSNIFLGMNNAGLYKVGHTRYLHAWTLGACLVVHADAALSMPEIRHRENALMGRDAAEVADLIAEAAADPALRLRLGEAGYQAYRRRFTGPVVARTIAERLRGMRT